MFGRLKPFRRGAGILADEGVISFHPVPEEAIDRAELRTGHLPEELKALWRELGFGRIKANVEGTKEAFGPNVVMSPDLVADAMTGSGFYEGLRLRSPGVFPFLDIGDRMFVALHVTADGRSFVADDFFVEGDTTVLATTIEEFMDQLSADPEFYLNPPSAAPKL